MTRTHDDRLLLNAYIDGELDPAHALEFERRLADDPELAAERARIEALRRVMAERLPREAASPELRRRIAALARPQPFGWRADWGAKWGSIAASVAIVRLAPMLLACAFTPSSAAAYWRMKSSDHGRPVR